MSAEEFAEYGLNLQNILAATMAPLSVPLDSPSSSETASCARTSPSSSSPASAGAADLVANALMDKAIREQGQKILTENLQVFGNIDQSLLDSPSEPKRKRKRTKRNPVWNFFDTDESHVAHCQQCQYNTKSAYSTNLKIHLRCHHKESYEKVVQLEKFQQELQNTTLKPHAGTPKSVTPNENEHVEDNVFNNMLSLFSTPEARNTSASFTEGDGSKRKRNRKHPVWKYFGDVSDKVVGCNMCEFRTNSAFSTNLKMHLKSHHKEEFIDVMDKEIELLRREGDPQEQAQEGKRRRRTVAELESVVERCRMSMLKDKAKQSPTLIAALSSPPKSSLPCSDNVDVNNQFRDPLMPQLNNIQPLNITNEVQEIPNLSPEQFDLSIFSGFTKESLKNLVKLTALNALIVDLGSDDILQNKAFRNLISILDPNFELPNRFPEQ